MPSAHTQHHSLPRRLLGTVAGAIVFIIAAGLTLEAVVEQLQEERYRTSLDSALTLTLALGVEGLRPLTTPDAGAGGGFPFALDRHGAVILGPDLPGESPLFEPAPARRMLAIGSGTVVESDARGNLLWCAYRTIDAAGDAAGEADGGVPDGGVIGWAVPVSTKRASVLRVRRWWIAGALISAGLGLLVALRRRRRPDGARPGADSGDPESEARAAFDSTPRVQLDTRLRERDRMEAIGRFAGGVGHDFNNLLATVRGNAELLLLDLPQDAASEELRETAASILSVTQRATELTSRLLACSHRLKRPRRFDCHRLIEELRDAAGRTLGPDIAFQTQLAALEHWVVGDEAALRDAILQLVENARDAMEGRGTLTIETRASALPTDDASTDDSSTEDATTEAADAAGGTGVRPAIVITVRDDGPGMDEATRARVFEPFFTTKDTGRGAGLGLTAVYGVVVGHCGTLEVESAPGAGTAMQLCIPLAPAEDPRSAPEPS